ncbi:putative peptidyl-prolyl isomerase FKBP12 [Besnoitia besnoiti]|uniref:peptidylprolyl isomerase n=1 Tax=Besnoitia besnoiti TaxID=94643 RepID=A0A2A9MFD8_BESBE|nr:putative peptidyl-prolyl isomerase FKBP12 [Besnoitia besnoiti]PFH34971.1 putative peptidyl-prolyl isomerase FKBP12 [Besnoitia besnoiti]
MAAAVAPGGSVSETETPRKDGRTTCRGRTAATEGEAVPRMTRNLTHKESEASSDSVSDNVKSIAAEERPRQTTRKRWGKNNPLTLECADAVVNGQHEGESMKESECRRCVFSSIITFFLSLAFLACLAIPLVAVFAPDSLSALPGALKTVEKLPASLSLFVGSFSEKPALLAWSSGTERGEKQPENRAQPSEEGLSGSARRDSWKKPEDTRGGNTTEVKGDTGPQSASSEKNTPQKKMAPLAALQYDIIKRGTGPTLQRGQAATVHATGSVLRPDGTSQKFWSTKDPGQQPFTWKAGLGQVIAGWDQGVLGMTVGETRHISIPASMGYGASGFPAWGIPPNADLQFEIELLRLQ